VDFPTFVGVMRTQRFRLARLDVFTDRWEGMVRRVVRGPLLSANSDSVVGRRSFLDEDADRPDRRRACASCWCRSGFESAAFWERYGRDGLGICIKTRVSRLHALLKESKEEILFGNVRYIDTRDDEEPVAGPPISLFVKDRAFAYENEVRFVRYTPSVDADVAGWSLDVPLTTRGFLCELLLHPDAPQWFAALVRDVMNDYKSDFKLEVSGLGKPLRVHRLDL
jgi:hypothetical protein